MRTGRHKDDEPIILKKGDILEICTDSEFEGEGLKIGCSYESLPESVKMGAPVLLHHGKIEGTISDIH